jgi:hypothetical protein
MSLRATLIRPTKVEATVTESELQWIIYTTAAAILNPSGQISPSILYDSNVIPKSRGRRGCKEIGNSCQRSR